MSKSFQDYVGEIHQCFDDISDVIEKGAEDLAGGGQELWLESKKHLSTVKNRLGEASEHLHSSSNEVQLQAHLAAMDAHDHWQNLKHTITSLLAQVQHTAQPTVDEVALQAHLAKMDARDFMAEKGHSLAEDFKRSIEKAQQLSCNAAADIKESCGGIIAGLPK
jgi:ElaB/YqjD/DUF883 family membrane-anchored ribosome-binding protein